MTISSRHYVCCTSGRNCYATLLWPTTRHSIIFQLYFNYRLLLRKLKSCARLLVLARVLKYQILMRLRFIHTQNYICVCVRRSIFSVSWANKLHRQPYECINISTALAVLLVANFKSKARSFANYLRTLRTKASNMQWKLYCFTFTFVCTWLTFLPPLAWLLFGKAVNRLRLSSLSVCVHKELFIFLSVAMKIQLAAEALINGA